MTRKCKKHLTRFIKSKKITLRDNLGNDDFNRITSDAFKLSFFMKEEP